MTSEASTALCGCKGIRFCANCKASKGLSSVSLTGSGDFQAFRKFVFSDALLRGVEVKNLSPRPSFEEIFKCLEQQEQADGLALGGILLIPNFLNEQEEVDLVKAIDKKEWMLSQSGRRKQDYGPRVNFKQKRLKLDCFLGLPHYTDLILNKMSKLPFEPLGGFRPVELCNLEYLPSRQSAIVMHSDDSWIWGDRLINLNLLSPCVMSFAQVEKKLLLYIPLSPRSLLCVFGEARYQWQHAIFPEHICERRISLTMRELTADFQEGGEHFEEHGKNLMNISNKRLYS